jgi:hypothetical protein
MDSISTTRDFFINQQGLSPDQADMIVSKGMEAYNQQSQPQQNMMQMASGGIARLGYQMGGSSMGVGTMPMDYGQSLQVPQQMPTNFSSAQSITSNPLLNYGQPQLGTAGGTPLSMNRGGIARLGYQTGGVTLPSQGSEMSQSQSMDPQQAQQALNTIIQILIENGLTPEQARELALQILQIFAAGGESAVEEFANQIEQQEQMEEMASGGIAGYAQRQGYFLGGIGKAIGKVFKGVGKAIKSIVKSDIGRIALTIGATMLLGPAGGMFSGAGLGAGLATQMGVSAAFSPFVAGAINAAAANVLTNIATGGKISLGGVLTAGALGGIGGSISPTTVGIDPTTGQAITTGTTTAQNLVQAQTNAGIANPNISGEVALPTLPSGQPNYAFNRESTLVSTAYPGTDAAAGAGKYTTVGPSPFNMSSTVQGGTTTAQTQPGIMQTLKTSLSSPIETLQNLGSKAVGLVQEYPKTSIAAAYGLGTMTAPGFRPQNENESDAEYQAEKNKFITDYGRNLGITNKEFYTREGAPYPFAANGGIMGYAAGGSMVPPARQIEGGIIELDARKTGGYIPYGKKERVDDVPAMLAKDEFVFTSRAVKAAGGGSARRGAAKMYKLMKQLESKGRKMEQGARA